MQTSVLWADRNSVFTVLGQHYLEAAGMAVTTAESAVECIRQLKLAPHDILILDDSLLWGGVDGILWWIDDTLPADERPCVLVSGVESPAKISSRTGIVAGHCLQKPYRLLTVLDAVLAVRPERPPVRNVPVEVAVRTRSLSRRPFDRAEPLSLGTTYSIKDVVNGVSGA